MHAHANEHTRTAPGLLLHRRVRAAASLLLRAER